MFPNISWASQRLDSGKQSAKSSGNSHYVQQKEDVK